jgi:hypothetical protein
LLLGAGKEFKPPDKLSNIFGLHPFQPRMKRILKSGREWPLVEISKEVRQKDVLDTLTFGNHKGELAKPILLKKLIEKDVQFGYSFAIPLTSATSIPGLCMAPMDITVQYTINELGRIVPKDRLTHDQSRKWSSGTSINSRMNKVLHHSCKYNFCIRCLINWVIAARQKYPGQHILATKIDYKSAYHFWILHFLTALQTATQLPDGNLAIITLQLTFGGGPFKWGIVSKSICDLANKLLVSKE